MNLLNPYTSLSLLRFVLATPAMQVGGAGWPVRTPPFPTAVGDWSAWRLRGAP